MSADRPSFEAIYMGLAQALSKRSTCSRAQVGCVSAS
jgi:deoxycytidylate deaminase